MKYFLPASLACAMALAACAPGTKNVKKQWTKDLQAYSFVPLYPARQDVNIGDIRIHLAEGGSQLFDSRLMWTKKANGVVKKTIEPSKAILPGIDVTRLGAVDIEAFGLTGLLGKLLGERVEASSSLHIALKKLTTSEISDVDVVYGFQNFVTGKLNSNDPKVLAGFCAAAITLGDKNFDEVRISMITRTVGFGAMEYFSGSGISNIAGGSNPANPASLNGQNGFVSTEGARVLGDESFEKKPIIIGVDAIMLNPYELKVYRNVETSEGITKELVVDLKSHCQTHYVGKIIAPPNRRK